MDSPVIDAKARRVAACLYRRFGAGLLTNDEIEEFQPESYERNLHLIWWHGIWPLYDDTRTYRLIGKDRLTPAGREHVARIVLFMRSDLPYRWPHAMGLQFLADLILFFATFLLYRPWVHRQRRCGGDLKVWPFFARAEYEEALHHPPYLAGARAA